MYFGRYNFDDRDEILDYVDDINLSGGTIDINDVYLEDYVNGFVRNDNYVVTKSNEIWSLTYRTIRRTLYDGDDDDYDKKRNLTM